jgi:flagellar hook-associated protein 3 FlgL
MVTRISTAGNYGAVLADLMAAEARQVDAGNRISTQKNGSDLKAYSQKAETLTAMQTVQARLKTYQAQNDQIAAKLANQDQALTTLSETGTAVRQAIEDALASDNSSTMMQIIQNQFQTATQAMNAQYDGKYLFAGGQIYTKPVTATQLSDLTAGPPISSFFQNDQHQTQAKLDDATTVTTGVLASNLGTNMLTAFQSLEAFHEGASGPFNGPLTDAQRTFLTNAIATWKGVAEGATQVAAQNGLVQQRVDAVKVTVTAQSDTLTGMMGDITDADMAKAVTDLTAAQTAVQATAQVIQALRMSSLLNLLPVG